MKSGLVRAFVDEVAGEENNASVTPAESIVNVVGRQKKSSVEVVARLLEENGLGEEVTVDDMLLGQDSRDYSSLRCPMSW